jgi:hypothetical protein
MALDLVAVKTDQARALLAEARDARSAKKVADMARAVEIFAKRQRYAQDAIDYATAVKVDAMTLMGEFLKAHPPQQGGPGRAKKGKRKTVAGSNGFLPDGISRQESSEAQTLVDLRDDQPAEYERVRAGKVSPRKATRVYQRKKKKKLAALSDPTRATHRADWQIHAGDCLPKVTEIKPGTPRLAFADPQYNLGLDYGEGVKADSLPKERYLALFKERMQAVANVLAPDGSLYVLINYENAAECKLALEGVGLTLRQWIIWYESFGQNRSRGFNRCHRHLLWCVKNPKRFVFHAEAVNRPSDRQAKYKDPRANPDGKTWDDVWGINPPIPRLTASSKERLEEFPTQLPLALLRSIVGVSSDPGDLVFRPVLRQRDDWRCLSGTGAEVLRH